MGHHEIARACGEEPLCAGAPACYRVAPHAFELSQKWAPEKGPWELAELNFRVPAHLFANNEFIPPSKARMEKIRTGRGGRDRRLNSESSDHAICAKATILGRSVGHVWLAGPESCQNENSG